MLVSAIHQHGSAIGIHMSPPFFWDSLPPLTLRHLSRSSQSLGLRSLHHTANSHWLSILHMLVCVFPCYSLHSSHPLLLTLNPTVSVSLFSMSYANLFDIREALGPQPRHYRENHSMLMYFLNLLIFNKRLITRLCWFLPYINMDQP